MVSVMKDVVTWLKQWYYTEDEVDIMTGNLQSQINNKAETSVVSALSNTVGGKADSVHTHSAGDITDSNSSNYGNIGISSSNATQSAINTAVNTKLGSLTNAELINVVQSLPTASSSTMNKLYLVANSTSANENSYDIYITAKTGTGDNITYSWEKVDDANLTFGLATTTKDGLMRKEDKAKLDNSMSIGFGTLGGTTSAFTVSITGVTLTHGTVIAVYNGVDNNSASATLKVNTLDAKPIYYKASAITASRFPKDTTALLMYNTTLVGTGCWQMMYSYDTTYTAEATASNIKMNGTQSVGSRSTYARGDHVHPSDTTKADKTDTLGTTITLADKGETNEGCIIFNTIS